MGFFDNLLSSLETSSSSMTREKYRQMSREELVFHPLINSTF